MLISALSEYRVVLDNLASPTAIQQQLTTMTTKELGDLIEAIGDPTKGKAHQMKLVDIAKIMWPNIAVMEQGILTLKAAYGESVSKFMARFASTYYTIGSEDARINNVDFKRAVQGALDIRVEKDMNTQAQYEIQRQKADLEARFQQEVMDRAMQLAGEMAAKMAQDATMKDD